MCLLSSRVWLDEKKVAEPCAVRAAKIECFVMGHGCYMDLDMILADLEKFAF